MSTAASKMTTQQIDALEAPELTSVAQGLLGLTDPFQCVLEAAKRRKAPFHVYMWSETPMVASSGASFAGPIDLVCLKLAVFLTIGEPPFCYFDAKPREAGA